MQKKLFILLFTPLCLVAALAMAEDGEAKAQKEARKISAMAADPTARPLVSQAIAEALKSSRLEIVQRRKAANLSYGNLFVAYQLSEGGKHFDDLLAALAGGKDIWQIGNDVHADWKQVAGEAKKMNDQLESSFYHYFLSPPQKSPEDLHSYNAAHDSVPADRDGLSEKDIAAAQDTFARCFRRARGMPMKGDMPDQQDRTSSQMESDPRQH
jgi:hypothetical protein